MKGAKSSNSPVLVSESYSSGHIRTIFPTSIPPEVKNLMIAAQSMEKTIFRKFVKVGLAHLQQSQTEEECEAAFENICVALHCETEEQARAVSEQYSGVVSLLQAVLRLSARTTRQQHLQEDLVMLGLRAEQASDVCRVVFGPARASIDQQLCSNAPALPTLTGLDWSMALAQGRSCTPNLIEPAIALTLETSDSESHKVSLDVREFHQLRHTVASLLQQMDVLETLPGGPRHTPLAAAATAAT